MADIIKQREQVEFSQLGKIRLTKPQTILSSTASSIDQPLASSFTKLSDFTNFHLQRSSGDLLSNVSVPRLNTASKLFSIPKLTPKFIAPPELRTELTPHELSLKKILDLKNIKLSDHVLCTTENTLTKSAPLCADPVIDLSTALRTANSIPIQIPFDNALENNENKSFIPNYIDCDQALTILMPAITKDCEIDISNISHALNRIKTISKFGKTLCSRYRCSAIPYVKHEFFIRHKIDRYAFEHPSPDDLILRQLNKWKRK